MISFLTWWFTNFQLNCDYTYGFHLSTFFSTYTLDNSASRLVLITSNLSFILLKINVKRHFRNASLNKKLSQHFEQFLFLMTEKKVSNPPSLRKHKLTHQAVFFSNWWHPISSISCCISCHFIYNRTQFTALMVQTK